MSLDIVKDCGDCLHREVCGYKEKLKEVKEAAENFATNFDEEPFTIDVKCNFYTSIKLNEKDVTETVWRTITPLVTCNGDE